MTKPHAIPTRIKHIIKEWENALQDQQAVFFDIALAVYRGEQAEVIEALREAALRNNLVLRSLTLLQAKEFEAAEEIIIQLKAEFERERK